jgi:hypothetical protein
VVTMFAPDLRGGYLRPEDSSICVTVMRLVQQTVLATPQ